MDKLRWVLDRHEQDIVRLNDYLLSRLDDVVPVTTVMHDLDWSRYRVLSTLETLVRDLETQQTGGRDDDKYDMQGKVIKINHSVQINTLALEYQYRKRSIAWVLLLEMLTEQVDSYENFANRYNISVAAVRSAKQKIQEAFLNQDIEVSKNNRIVGNEVVVRAFFMQLMRYYHAQIETTIIQSTPQDHLVTDQLVDKLLDIYGLTQDMTNERVMSLQVLIWLIRVQNGHYLHDQDLPHILVDAADWPESYQQLNAHLIDMMREFVDLPEHVLRIEAQFAILTMFTSGLVTDVPEEMLRSEVQTRLKRLTLTLRNNYETAFQSQLPSAVEAQLLQATLSRNLRTLYFLKDLVQSSVDIGVLERNFPIHAKFTSDLLVTLADIWQIEDVPKFRRVMFEDYFNAIIVHLTPAMILPPIRVAIGFVYHPGMDEIIRQQLANRRNINFEFVSVGEPADFYISDIAIESEYTVPGYIWNVFPDNHTINHFVQDAMQLSIKYYQNRKR